MAARGGDWSDEVIAAAFCATSMLDDIRLRDIPLVDEVRENVRLAGPMIKNLLNLYPKVVLSVRNSENLEIFLQNSS